MALDAITSAEDEKTRRAIVKEKEFVDGFKVFAARAVLNSVFKVRCYCMITAHMSYVILVGVRLKPPCYFFFSKVYNEFQTMIVKSCMRTYFKALRLSMYLKRSWHMLHRKKLANWIRICFR
jgi:hypothetical protein